jgi:para-aminobenzoate synthetase
MTLHPVKVMMNDEFDSWDAFMRNVSSTSINGGAVNHPVSTLDHFDCIIISPGPGRPSHASDMGIVLEAIRRNPDVPILGVCLGHQAIGYVYGCDVKLAPCGPVHGLMSSVFYSGVDGDANQLFDGIPQNFVVVRYHSLVVQFPQSDLDIEPIAWCSDDFSSSSDEKHDRLETVQTTSISNSTTMICMGLRHKEYPHYGVQFHPESIGTAENGYNLLCNFCDLAFRYNMQRKLADPLREFIPNAVKVEAHASTVISENVKQLSSTTNGYTVIIHKIEKDTSYSLPTPEQVFEEVYGSRHNSFWLDSSTGETHMELEIQLDRKGCPISSNSRFSIMGSDDGPLSCKIEYYGREHNVERRGLFITSSAEENATKVLDTDILAYLRKQFMGEQEVSYYSYDSTDDSISTLAGNIIPFDFCGGYVGFLGYEVRYDCLDDGCRGDHCTVFKPEKTNCQVPSAAFLFADRSLVFDHHLHKWYVIGVAQKSNGNASIKETKSWIRNMSATIRSFGLQHTSEAAARTKKANVKQLQGIQFTPNRSKEQYLKDLARSHDEIRRGESYELCVTNQLTAELNLPRQSTKRVHESPLELYKRLRRRNPAPFSSYFNLFPKELSPDAKSAQVSICCSSPERFLSIKKATNIQDLNEFVIESKPIKGTAARYTGPESTHKDQLDFVNKIDSEIAARLKESVKDRAENLMIVDLLRNDFGRVCKVGSVHVPKLMQIETYATVHQMVSTVRGTVDGRTTNAIDVIEACFPGGSMTGAPKHRTVEILDEIEQGVSRGPYSGCLGYISLNGCMDMNIIIRTAVLTPSQACDQSSEAWKVSIGCGGAITALSDSNAEYEEMLLKSKAVREAISEWVQERQQYGSNND